VLIAETGLVSERLRVREIDDDEGQLLVRIIRRGSGSVVTWRRAPAASPANSAQRARSRLTQGRCSA